MDASKLRAQIAHPVIDSDAHWLEYAPLLEEGLRKIGGDRVAQRFNGFYDALFDSLGKSPGERRYERIAQEAFWGAPARNTRDRATAMMPRLLHERMDEFGFDFCVMYPTLGLGPLLGGDGDMCRAYNTYSADYFGPYADRLTPVALIPTDHPDRAIEELEFATGPLGLKAVVMGGVTPRAVPAAVDGNVEAGRKGPWFDVLALDSEHDYDPLWARCLELGVAPTFHSGTRSQGLRRSPSNFVYNHIGHFREAGEAMCKALLLGGVTRRFPKLRFAFLECGSSWACQVFADLIEHWEKRNLEALEHTNPANLDRELLVQLAKEYGNEEMVSLLDEQGLDSDLSASPLTGGEASLDDFAACEIERKEDLRDLFVDPFYFGCEADDRTNGWAFNGAVNPFGAKLNALFSSDIGHFDVMHMNRVLLDAYELVEDGVMGGDDFRAFTFENPARFWTSNNPHFFVGTAVEKEVEALLG